MLEGFLWISTKGLDLHTIKILRFTGIEPPTLMLCSDPKAANFRLNNMFACS